MKIKRGVRSLTGVFFTVIVGCLFLISCSLPKESEQWDITEKGDEIVIKAGMFERKFQKSENAASSLIIKGENVVNGATSGDFSVTLWKASPNKKPQGMAYSSEAGVEQKNDEKNSTDALKVKKKKGQVDQSVQWIDSVSVSGGRFGDVFDDVQYSIHSEKAETKQLEVTFSAQSSGEWKGLEAKVIYEIYDGSPAIRKRISLTNNSTQWLKLSNLVIDDVAVTGEYSTKTLFTPDVRGIESSIIAFHNADASAGVIVASEVPSKLRSISEKGASGYNRGFFEWVLGPGESFDSEPVLIYAFSGESYPTVSAISTAMDRCVEGEFKQFLKKNILKTTADIGTLVPVFCTWTNYAASIDERNMHEAADIASNIGFQCFQLDAGWSETGGNWGVSTPYPEKNKFPDLVGLMDYIRTKKMNAGLWYSIFISEEDGTNLSKGAVLASLPLVKRAGGVGLSMCYNKSREKYINDLVYMNKTYHATYFKQDLSNLCFGDIAEGHESRTLKESYLRGLRGLFQIQDGIRSKAPEAWLQLSHEIYWETPGPGADIAVLQHADSYHASPNEYWGAGHRKQLVNDSWKYDADSLQQKLLQGALRSRRLMYSHRGLPLERIEIFGAVTTNYKGSLSAEVIDRQVCSWLMGAPNSFSGDLTSLTEENVKQYKSRFAMLKRLQEKYGIYSCFQFSGVPEPTDEGWHWWGKLNPKGCGVVVVVRGNSGEKSRNVNVPWVLADKEYRLKGVFSGKDFGIFYGKQLQEGVLTISLDTYGQEILELSDVM